MPAYFDTLVRAAAAYGVYLGTTEVVMFEGNLKSEMLRIAKRHAARLCFVANFLFKKSEK